MTTPKESGLSAGKAWLIVLVALIDDLAVLALVLLGLWYFNVRITWTLLLIIVLGVGGYAALVHAALVPALRRRKVTGREGMVGMTGRVTEPLDPKGMVEIQGEYWQAKSNEDKIEIGATVEVVAIYGLMLEVREKPHEQL